MSKLNPKRFRAQFEGFEIRGAEEVWIIYSKDESGLTSRLLSAPYWATRERAEDCLRGFLGIDGVLPDSGPWKYGARMRSGLK